MFSKIGLIRLVLATLSISSCVNVQEGRSLSDQTHHRITLPLSHIHTSVMLCLLCLWLWWRRAPVHLFLLLWFVSAVMFLHVIQHTSFANLLWNLEISEIHWHWWHFLFYLIPFCLCTGLTGEPGHLTETPRTSLILKDLQTFFPKKRWDVNAECNFLAFNLSDKELLLDQLKRHVDILSDAIILKNVILDFV